MWQHKYRILELLQLKPCPIYRSQLKEFGDFVYEDNLSLAKISERLSDAVPETI